MGHRDSWRTQRTRSPARRLISCADASCTLTRCTWPPRRMDGSKVQDFGGKSERQGEFQKCTLHVSECAFSDSCHGQSLKFMTLRRGSGTVEKELARLALQLCYAHSLLYSEVKGAGPAGTVESATQMEEWHCGGECDTLARTTPRTYDARPGGSL